MPFYTARLEKELKEFEPRTLVKSFNTYTSLVGKLHYSIRVPSLDVVFSVNGDNRKSRAFSWAKNNHVRLIMNWSGTDVLTCTENFKRGDVDQELVDYAEHTCQCSWIQEELKAIGIAAEIIQFQAYQVMPASTLPATLKVLCRISQDRPDFYGMKELIALANSHPDIEFTAIGISTYSEALPANITLKGWVDDMDALFQKHLVSLRFPIHDGLSPFVMESLARGLHVLYRFPFDEVIHAPDLDSLQRELSVLKEKFEKKELGWNQAGMNLIKEEYSERKVFEEFTQFLGL
jgi:hypothetical protein